MTNSNPPSRCPLSACQFVSLSAFRTRPCRAFTLIELLVVISIIAILIGLLFPAFKGVQDQAKKVQTKNDLTQIVTAVNAFYTEYGQYPCPPNPGGDGADFVAADDSNQSDLMNELRAPSSTTAPALNPRRVSFLNAPSAKDPTLPGNGAKSGVASDGRWYDAWGSAYRIKIDSNYNNTLTNPYTANAGLADINTGVIAWSIGKDQKGGSGDKKSTDSDDDVISWQ
jgi:prepilin-type N-terminal cleavage/methylation domain-containing protein